MRKVYALFILFLVFFPLAFSAMTLTSIRPWVLDRGFYERMVDDPRLYEVLLTDELPELVNQELLPAEQLPLVAVRPALREVVTLDYLRAQSLSVIDRVFNYLEGRDRTLEISLDFTPVKATLAADGGVRFAQALAESLPTCAADQPPVARCDGYLPHRE